MARVRDTDDLSLPTSSTIIASRAKSRRYGLPRLTWHCRTPCSHKHSSSNSVSFRLVRSLVTQASADNHLQVNKVLQVPTIIPASTSTADPKDLKDHKDPLCLRLTPAQWRTVSSPMAPEEMVAVTDANHRVAPQSLSRDLMVNLPHEQAQTPSRAAFLNPWPRSTTSSVARLHQTA
jgi:hypothetical protein